MEVFPQNTLCCYTARLPQAIQFDHEAYWEVALVEMIHPTQIKNIVENQNNMFTVQVYNQDVQKFMTDRFGGVPDSTNEEEGINVKQSSTYVLKIPAGYYFSGEHLVNTIADRFNALFGKALEKAHKSVTIEYYKISHRLLMKFSESKVLAIQFCGELHDILGGDRNLFRAPNEPPYIGNNLDFAKHFRFPVEMNQGLNLIFVYSDVVEYNVVGHTSVPLLRVIPFKIDSTTVTDEEGGNTYHVHREFVHPHYLPVSKSYFDTVNITIKGDLGQNIPFTKGKVTVKLHFRKRVL
jgi:hypothetical protein